MQFYKYQGLGNDFVLIDLSEMSESMDDVAKQVIFLCDRRFGIGADGVLFFKEVVAQKSVQMVYFNADGNRAETCFNGLRCIAKHAVLNGYVECGAEFIIEQDAGTVEAFVADLSSDLVRITLIGPVFEPSRVPVALDSELIEGKLVFDSVEIVGTALSLGNPHFVSWTDNNDLEALNDRVKSIGNRIEHSAHFPNKTNFELAHKVSDLEVQMAVWERGVGHTFACGSGATATVCAGVKIGILPYDEHIQVQMQGGTLKVNVTKDFNSVEVIGLATFVFKGDIIL